jgi:hypothetical protein
MMQHSKDFDGLTIFVPMVFSKAQIMMVSHILKS